MAQTQAEAAVMASTAAKFEQANTALQGMLSTLMSELSMLNGAWKGLGARAFEQVKTQYAADLKSLNNALGETAGAIRSSGTSYEAADTEAASRVTRTGGTFTLPL
ncbi:WXG100 family type VII secretion target [Actinoplanes sp. NEAU-A11]|jgi:WXG100 family type VII secretion target|uniref:ESAT-6-like protein n=2 Tax=Actinoplanes aureus TaxID=2792083 RepID=A0A931G4G3_9ACTN|nr:WXG100 family type VII secretion target [Actinoplanes aureus]MBG0565259.1 WXG100 family type VII secretion target [Actinoplanes aureus]